MRRASLFMIVSGWVSLIANVLGILGYFSGEGIFAGLELDGGLLIAASFLTLAYALVVWSAWAWKRVQVTHAPGEAALRAAFMLDALDDGPRPGLVLYTLRRPWFGGAGREPGATAEHTAGGLVTTAFFLVAARMAADAVGKIADAFGTVHLEEPR